MTPCAWYRRWVSVFTSAILLTFCVAFGARSFAEPATSTRSPGLGDFSPAAADPGRDTETRLDPETSLETSPDTKTRPNSETKRENEKIHNQESKPKAIKSKRPKSLEKRASKTKDVENVGAGDDVEDEEGTGSAEGEEDSDAVTSTIPPARISVSFRRQPIFFLADDGTTQAMDRAENMSKALEQALLQEALSEGPSVVVQKQPRNRASIHVRGHFIGEVDAEDAKAAGAKNLDAFVRIVQEGLGEFVESQLRRAALQEVALHVFFSVLIFVFGIVALYLIRIFFRKADEYLDDRSTSIRPIRLLGVPIMGAEAVGAAFAILVAVGRLVAQIAIAIATVSLALSQFETTRLMVRDFLRWASKPVINGLEHLVAAIPGLALAALLIIAIKGALRVIEVLFDVSASGQTRWLGLNGERALVLRIVTTIAVVLIGAILAVASAFGRFHTPIEIIVVVIGSAGVLAWSPVLASGAAGLVLLWRGSVQVGRHVRTRRFEGEITEVSVWDIEVEGLGGRRIRIPSLAFFFSNAEVANEDSRRCISLRVKRTKRIDEIVETLKTTFERHETQVGIDIIGFTEESVQMVLSTQSTPDKGSDPLGVIAELDATRTIEILEARLSR